MEVGHVDRGAWCSWMRGASIPLWIPSTPMRLSESDLSKVPRNHGLSTTLVASLCREGMGLSMVIEVATTKKVSEIYAERFLTPTLRPGQVVMGNLGAHRPSRVRELIEERGASSSTCNATSRTSTR